MKRKLFLMFSILVIAIGQSCEPKSEKNEKVGSDEPVNKNAPFYTHQLPDGHPRISKQYDSTKIEDFWPFIIYKDGSYMVVGNLNSDTTLDKYGIFLERYGGEGTGYNWAALIKVILKKENPALLKHVDFDPEASAFYLFADNESHQREFAEFASKSFKDTAKLIRYLTGSNKQQALEFNPED